MAYPISSKYGRAYLGNKNKKEVHKIGNEQTNCQTDEIIKAGNAVGFSPDTLQQAHGEGYDNCYWCIGSSTR